MTNVSQERLSEDDLQKWERIMRKCTDSKSTVVLFLIEDLRKSRAAEAERDRYKAALEEIVTAYHSEGTDIQVARQMVKIAKTALEGGSSK